MSQRRPSVSRSKSLAMRLGEIAWDLRALASDALEGRGLLDLQVVSSPTCDPRFVGPLVLIEPLDLIDDAMVLETYADRLRTFLR